MAIRPMNPNPKAWKEELEKRAAERAAQEATKKKAKEEAKALQAEKDAAAKAKKAA